MAWKVYDYMEGKEGNPRFPNRDLPVYGPLPRKRWVPMPGERYRVKRSVTNGAARVGSAKDYTEERAVLYARWLAQRDGKTIPDGYKVAAVWSRNGAGDKRVCAVQFGGVTISIPHWDWVPQMTEEHDQIKVAA